MADYKKLAQTILENVGGSENVRHVVHCATRLRFTLRDETLARTDELKKTKGVLTVVSAGGQYQVVIGPDVPQVYQEIIALGVEAGGSSPEAAEEKADERSGLSRLLEGIASIFQPVIPAITGAGLIKAVMALLTTVGWLRSGTQTAIILGAMADSAFYFLPVLLAASVAKKFRANQGTAMALGGLLVYPSLVSLMSEAKTAGAGIRFLGVIPIQAVTAYPSSVIPIILGVIFLSYVEHFMQRVSPKAIKFFAVPFVSLLVAGTVTLALLGPLGTWASDLIQALFTWLKGVAPWLVPTVVGVFTPLLVMTGTHYGLIPIGTNNLGSVGHDAVVGPGMLVSNVAQGAAGLAVSLRSKNPETKQLASSAGITGVLGITEPVLYGVNLRFGFPLYASMIGGGVGGLFLGLTGVERFGAGSPGLLVLPVYIPGETFLADGSFTMMNMAYAVIGVLLAMAVSFAACWVMFGIWEKRGRLEPAELGEASVPHEEAESPVEGTIAAPIEGEVIALADVADEVFSTGAMGAGVAIEPLRGEVYAPCDGRITSFFPTGHALGIMGPDGVELLIHVGMDTVKLDGRGFTPLVGEGDRVEKGQPLLRFDMEMIRKEGLALTTPVVVVNSGEFGAVSPAAQGRVTPGEPLIRYRK